MTTTGGRWEDLLARVGSGAFIACIGVFAMWLGGLWFHGFVAVVCAVMVWELARMLGAVETAYLPAIAGLLALMIAGELPGGFALPLLFFPALYRSDAMRGSRTQFAIYTAAIMVAGYGLMVLRDDFGFIWMGWLAGVVIATDISGYFAGRIVGGPKIWPRVSPKKTWSGTLAGWIAAMAVSLPFVFNGIAGWEILGVALAASMASQLGDVAESAIKRRSGVKDASGLIPGHGGLFDRFDSMLGASVFLLVAGPLVGFPPVPA